MPTNSNGHDSPLTVWWCVHVARGRNEKNGRHRQRALVEEAEDLSTCVLLTSFVVCHDAL